MCETICNCALWQADSGFFCEGYSSDEDTLVKEEFRGNIIKQGCLLKQVKLESGQKCHLFLFFTRCQHIVNINRNFLV